MIGRTYLDALQKRLEVALAEAALRICERARELAPSQSGALCDSITAEDNTVIATAPHAAIVEQNQPFLRPALREVGEEIAVFIRSQS